MKCKEILYTYIKENKDISVLISILFIFIGIFLFLNINSTKEINSVKDIIVNNKKEILETNSPLFFSTKEVTINPFLTYLSEEQKKEESLDTTNTPKEEQKKEEPANTINTTKEEDKPSKNSQETNKQEKPKETTSNKEQENKKVNPSRGEKINSQGTDKYNVKDITVLASAYTFGNNSNGGNSLTASGKTLKMGYAAGPKDLPFGTVVDLDGYGKVTVEDRGGDIKRINDSTIRLDILLPSEQEALNFGRKTFHAKLYMPK